MPKASAGEIMVGLIQVCAEEEMLSNVLAIEAIVMLGSKDPNHAESFIRASIADAEVLNRKIQEAIDGLG